MGKSGVNRSVRPSGSAFLTKSIDARAAAPGLFSTITVEANGTCSRSAISRAMMSVPPPAGNPTTMRSGRPIAWARTPRAAAPASGATSIEASRRRRVGMVLLRLEARLLHDLLGDHPLLPDLGCELL